MTIIWDIETGPSPDAKEFLRPFKPHSGWKDPEKIEAARLIYEAEALEEAALDPMTAQILTIGYRELGGDTTILAYEDEKQNLSIFWEVVEREPLSTLVGFCSESFDLPMLFARSWVHGLKPLNHLRRGRYWSDYSIDLQRIWLCGRQNSAGVSLDRVCRVLKLGCKPDNGVTGANFAQMFATDRPKALEYAANDVDITYKLYEHLCL